jgi:hypothetical protein
MRISTLIVLVMSLAKAQSQIKPNSQYNTPSGSQGVFPEITLGSYATRNNDGPNRYDRFGPPYADGSDEDDDIDIKNNPEVNVNSRNNNNNNNNNRQNYNEDNRERFDEKVCQYFCLSKIFLKLCSIEFFHPFCLFVCLSVWHHSG